MRIFIFFVIFLFSASSQSSSVPPPPILEEPKSALDLFNESLSGFDNEVNDIRSSIYQPNPSYQVEVAYVIPQGEKPRPRANEVIKEIFTIVQKHYYEQLGVTFELKEPLITTIPTRLKLMHNSKWNMSVELTKNRLKRNYSEKQNVIFFIIEGDNGAGLGGYNMAQSGFLWNQSYETYIKDPNLLGASVQNINSIHGWSHELGHALGLGHTAEYTVPCLARNGVKVGKLPSLIMQHTDILDSVYNYPFIEEEKSLLLQPDYYPQCRVGREIYRPHSSKFLRIKLDY
jgi:hypothetical protein